MNDFAYEQFYKTLHDRFASLVKEHKLDTKSIEIHVRALSPEEAIGNPGRTDYPIMRGKEQMLQASYKGVFGQVFSDAPSSFSGTVGDVLKMDILADNHARGLFIATMNAVMRSLSLIEGTVHCKDEGPKRCAQQIGDHIQKIYGNPQVLLVGFQPALVEVLGSRFSLRVLDLNPETVGTTRCGICIEDSIKDRTDALQWASLVLCTGSTLANGTIVNYLDIGKDVVFFGTTLAGAAKLMGLQRWCFASL
ncbi:Rossmann-like domain-containing protein [uncultured Sphaerochaeta sp.]|uniref:Rossmann-like domain-containing protein n=1 Tax=uncultured Sphaerochaeta sp. TaxID=886478 RepID=UPI002A0A3D66|nr:DUF364 domain-containing protein [uncultured Sphaerochaeta sp.]